MNPCGCKFPICEHNTPEGYEFSPVTLNGRVIGGAHLKKQSNMEIKYKATADQIREECQAVADMLTRKNESYGDSALEPKRIFSRADAMEQIRVRLDDKLSRLSHGNGDDFGEDVEQDIMGYLILLRIARKRKQEKDRIPARKAPVLTEEERLQILKGP